MTNTEADMTQVTDPVAAVREALGPYLADRCLGRPGHVASEAEEASAKAYYQAVRGPHVLYTFVPSDPPAYATHDVFDWFPKRDIELEASHARFRLWHAHARRAYRLFLADIIREDRMREQVALSRERMAKERTPMCFWLSEDDALNMVRDD